MATALTNEEKETIITFDETPGDAVVFTYSKAWQKQIEKKLGIKPTMNNGFGGREYQIPKKRIRMPWPARIPRVLSPEQRQKIAQRLSEGRHQKSPNSSGKQAAISAKRDENLGGYKTIARQKQAQKSQ